MKALSRILNLVDGHDRYAADRVDLIAANAWVSRSARSVMGSSLANHYCIGVPGRRLYAGCAYIDMIEREVIRLATRLFGTEHAVSGERSRITCAPPPSFPWFPASGERPSPSILDSRSLSTPARRPAGISGNELPVGKKAGLTALRYDRTGSSRTRSQEAAQNLR